MPLANKSLSTKRYDKPVHYSRCSNFVGEAVENYYTGIMFTKKLTCLALLMALVLGLFQPSGEVSLNEQSKKL